jgi:hypothetical protein
MAMLPTPPVAPETITGPFGRRQAIVFHAHHGQSGRETSGSERHRVGTRQARGQLHHPVGGQAGHFGIAAVMGNADVVAGGENLVSRLETRIGTGHDAPGQVDAADAGKAPDDAPGSRCSQGVLVVDARVRDGDGDFAGIELRFVHFDKATGNLAVFLIDQVSLETHSSLLESDAAPAGGRYRRDTAPDDAGDIIVFIDVARINYSQCWLTER